MFIHVTTAMSFYLCVFTGWSFMNEMNEAHRANADHKVSLWRKNIYPLLRGDIKFNDILLNFKLILAAMQCWFVLWTVLAFTGLREWRRQWMPQWETQWRRLSRISQSGTDHQLARQCKLKIFVFLIFNLLYIILYHNLICTWHKNSEGF